MLNIRINFTLNVKRLSAGLVAGFLILAHLITPAYAVQAVRVATFKEKVVSVSLSYLNVTTTKTQAKLALASPYLKYFDPQTIAFLEMYSKGASMAQWQCLNSLWQHESHFNPKALNMRSKALGIAQFLPTTWVNYKIEKTYSPALQIKYGLHYIKVRYGSTCGAWDFWQQHGWY